jgi:hypothetical protein
LLPEDLPEAHKALKELLPEGAAKHSNVITLQGRQYIHIQSLRGCHAIN